MVTEFEAIEIAESYESSKLDPVLDTPSELKIMTWNIRFGAGRIPWLYDSCGDRVILSENEVLRNLESVVSFINAENPDILLLQEVDVSSKRSGYIDQVQWILDNTNMNYGAYASMWKADFIPSDGLGKVNAGNVVLSKWPVEDFERIQLPLRGDQGSLEQYFYLRRNILKTKIIINSEKEIYAICTHTTAFATDDTKRKQIDQFYQFLDSIGDDEIFVAGGDLNALSSAYDNSKRDYCNVDKCEDEICDNDYLNNKIYEGSYFNHLSEEQYLLDPLYNFNSAIPLAATNEELNYTHSTWNESEDLIDSDGPFNRKLDYIFSSEIFSNGYTHGVETFYMSDHAAVSGIINIE